MELTDTESAMGEALVRLGAARSEPEAMLARNALRFACKAYTVPGHEPVDSMVTWAAKRGPVIVQDGQRVSFARLLRWKPSHPRDGARVRFSNGTERTFPLHAVRKAKEGTNIAVIPEPIGAPDPDPAQ